MPYSRRPSLTGGTAEIVQICPSTIIDEFKRTLGEQNRYKSATITSYQIALVLVKNKISDVMQRNADRLVNLDWD